MASSRPQPQSRSGKAEGTPAPYSIVGKLHHLGLTKRRQVALILPSDYEDFRNEVHAVIEAPMGERVVMRFIPSGQLRVTFKNNTPMTRFVVTDSTGQRYGATFFGDDTPWTQAMASGEFYAVCQVDCHREELTVLLHQPVPPEWAGRLRPKYKAKAGVFTAEELRNLVEGWLPDAIPLASTTLGELLAPIGKVEHLLADPAINCKGWTLDQVLQEVHIPSSPKMAKHARRAMLTLAALGSFMKAQEHRPGAGYAKAFPNLPTLPERISKLPFPLTEEQVVAVRNICVGISQPEAMRHLLIGDVGTGKSCIFYVVALALADVGGRTAIMVPNQVLGEQIHNEIRETWPDVRIQLISGESGETVRPDTQIAIGTTALLFRTTSPFDFIVIDEEQKFSVDQKRQLTVTGAHQLTVSATPLPRSLALSRFGAHGISEVREQHTPKFIETKYWAKDVRGDLFDELRYYLRQGGQLLVVYPLREVGAPPEEGESPKQGVQAVAAAVPLWEQFAPGKVRALTGEDSGEHKSAVIADMKDKRAQILLATTVVEVGVTLPSLRRLLIVDPERHGVMTIHQLRGRVARKGGEGWCDLYSSQGLNAKQQEKISRFLECKNGFEVAELDLRLRGHGDLALATKYQSGADRTFLFGDPISPEDMTRAEPVWHRFGGMAAQTIV